MGCVIGRKKFVANESLEGQDANSFEVMLKLGFTPGDVDLLYTAFWDIDADSSGLIRPEELFAYFEVEGTPFEYRIFALFDEDHSGVINFLEFVCTLWNVLTFPQADFGAIAYLLKDPSGKSSITYTDVRILFEMLHNRKLERDRQLNAVFEQLKKDLDPKVTIVSFTNWVSKYPSIVAPLSMLQLHLRLQIMGERFWVKMENNRKNDKEQGQLNYCKQLQDSVKEKNRLFRWKLEEEAAQQKRNERIGKGPNLNARANIARKESEVLSYFQLKPRVKKLTRIYPTNSFESLKTEQPRELAENKNSSDEALGKSSKPSEDGTLSAKQSHHPQHSEISPRPPSEKQQQQQNNNNNNNKKTDPLDDSLQEKKVSAKQPVGRRGKKQGKEEEGGGGRGEEEEAKRKKKKREYLELVRGEQRKQPTKNKPRKQSSIFDIFREKKKLNYDVLDEQEAVEKEREEEAEHLKVQKKAVPIRRRRSSALLAKKPNLVKREENSSR